MPGQRSIGFGRRKPRKDFNLFLTWLRSSARCFGSTTLLRRKMSSFSSPSTPLVASLKPFTSPSSLPSPTRKLEYVHYTNIYASIHVMFYYIYAVRLNDHVFGADVYCEALVADELWRILFDSPSLPILGKRIHTCEDHRRNLCRILCLRFRCAT